MLKIIQQGYKLAKTPKEVAKVKFYEKEIDARLARCNKLLDEFFAIGKTKKGKR